MKFIYPAVIHDDGDGLWAEFPDLEYTSSTGATLTELLTNAQEAMELFNLRMAELCLKPLPFAIYRVQNPPILHSCKRISI